MLYYLEWSYCVVNFDSRKFCDWKYFPKRFEARCVDGGQAQLRAGILNVSLDEDDTIAVQVWDTWK
jgi:hypothetical protein